MSETAKNLFDGMDGLKEKVQAVTPGLKSVLPEVQAEVSRLGRQGASEIASALFSGQAFVLYGPGQIPSKIHEQNRGGMER